MKFLKNFIYLGCFCFLFSGALSAQEEKIKENWGEFKKVWKEVYEYMMKKDDEGRFPGIPFGSPYKPMKDKELKLYAKVGDLFEKAGFFVEDDEELDTTAFTLKKLFKLGIVRSSGGFGIELIIGPGRDRENPREGYRRLKEGLEMLEDEEDVEDAIEEIRRGLKILEGFKEDATRFQKHRALRVIKALALGEDFPERPKPSPELAKRIQELIKRLGHESFMEREKAEKELLELGELAESALRKALEKEEDAEIRQRIERILSEEEEEEEDEEGRGPFRRARAILRLVERVAEPEEFEFEEEDEEEE